MEHGPLVGQVLAGREPRRVEAGVARPFLRSGPESTRPTLAGVSIVAASRPRRSSASPVPTPRTTCSAWSRTTSRPRAGESAGAAAHGEGAGDRAARVFRQADDDFLVLTEPALGEVCGRPRTHALAAKARSCSRSTRRARVRRRRRGSRRISASVMRSSTGLDRDASVRKSSSGCGSRPECPAGPRDRRADAAGGGGAHRRR